MLLGLLVRRVRRAAHAIVLGFSVAVFATFHLQGASRVTLAWDPGDTNVIAGYRVYTGVVSRTYTNSVDAGLRTSVTLSNLVLGATYYFAATTYNSFGLESDYSAELVFVNTAANQPPTLNPLNNLSIIENAGPQTVNLTGISSGSASEAQLLTVSAFSSNPGLIPTPSVNYVSPNSTGTIAFTPVPNAYGSNNITVMVDDGGAVSNTVIRSFAVIVNPVNDTPTLDPIDDLVINQNAGRQTVTLSGISAGSNETQTLTITATSSNPSLIPNPTVNYTSPNPTGSLNFMPATNATGSASITVAVNDGQPTNSTVTRAFTVAVNSTTTTPPPLTNAIVAPNSFFRFVLNPPYPNGDHYSFSLDSTAPEGARIGKNRGVTALTWTPTSAQASTTNLILIHVTDANNPALNTNQTVLVTVLDYLTLVPHLAAAQVGQGMALPLAVVCSEDATNVSVTFGFPTNRFSNPSITMTSSSTGRGTVQLQGTNLVVRISAAPGQVFQGSNIVARLNFQTRSNQSSSFVCMPARNLSGMKGNGHPYVDCVNQAAPLVLVNDVPLLQGNTSATGTRLLNLYGRVGTRYTLQYSTNSVTAGWYSLLNYTQTNVAQAISVDTNPPAIFYRLRQ